MSNKLFNSPINDKGLKYDANAIVVLSGGQDSVTCLYWAKEKFEKVYAINFRYGQRHGQETEYAKNVCDKIGVSFVSVNIEALMEVNQSALLDKTSDINKTGAKGLPSSFVPNRNQIFLTIAHSYAQKLGCDYLVTGVCQTDYSGYPDCRREFIDSLEKTTNLGSDDHIKILTPLMYLDKADTFQLAEELGCLEVIVNDTITCYNGDETINDWGKGCGECPSCGLRKKGYYEFIDRGSRKD